MAIPSKDFNAPADSEIDVDSPGNETLLTKIRDSLINLEEWLGKNYTAAVDHDHDGANSKPVVGVAAGSIGQTEIATGGVGQSEIASSAVGQGELKTATGEISETIGNLATEEINAVLPGGQFGFMPRVKASTAVDIDFKGFSHDQAVINGAYVPTSYTTVSLIFSNDFSGARTAYAQQVYVQASPPYKIGDKNWGHFLFVLRNIITGEIKSAYEAEDPPWAYNGPDHNAKDSKERIEAVPHPFKQYFDKDPALDGYEIQLIDLSDYDVKTWKKDSAKKGKGILDDLNEGTITFNPKGAIIKPSDIQVAGINGFSDKVKIRKRN